MTSNTSSSWPSPQATARNGAQLAVLTREITLFRVLNNNLGARGDNVRVPNWNLEAPPFYIELE